MGSLVRMREWVRERMLSVTVAVLWTVGAALVIFPPVLGFLGYDVIILKEVWIVWYVLAVGVAVIVIMVERGGTSEALVRMIVRLVHRVVRKTVWDVLVGIGKALFQVAACMLLLLIIGGVTTVAMRRQRGLVLVLLVVLTTGMVVWPFLRFSLLVLGLLVLFLASGALIVFLEALEKDPGSSSCDRSSCAIEEGGSSRMVSV